MLDYLTGVLPEEMLVLLIATLPVSELRGSIPFAQGMLHMPPLTAFVWSVIGNIIPAVLLLRYLGPFSELLSRKFAVCRRFFGWLFARTRRKSDLIHRYGYLGLVLFVAVPLPATGAWTGSIAAWLLGLSMGRALGAVVVGVLIAGVIVTAAVSGTISVLRAFV